MAFEKLDSGISLWYSKGGVFRFGKWHHKYNLFIVSKKAMRKPNLKADWVVFSLQLFGVTVSFYKPELEFSSRPELRLIKHGELK